MALQQLYIIPFKRCRKSIQRLILQSRLSDPVLHESQCGFFSKGSIINKIFYPRLRGDTPIYGQIGMYCPIEYCPFLHCVPVVFLRLYQSKFKA